MGKKYHIGIIRISILILVTNLYNFNIIKAQDDDFSEFNKLRTPTSPAFTLLGIAPISVERPANPSAFAASILSATNNLTEIPKNIAMEIAPYWMFSHPQLSWQKCDKPNVYNSILQTTTLTIGSSEIGDSLKPATGFAIGLRTNLFSGAFSKKAKKKINEAIRTNHENSLRIDEIAQPFIKIETDYKDRMLSTEKDSERRQNIMIKCQDKIDSIKRKIIEKDDISTVTSINEETEREGFFWDLAGGASFKFPDNIADSGKFRGYGIWTTLGWISENWNYVVVFRKMGGNEKADSLQNLFDIGARIIYVKNSYGISLEAVTRKYDYPNAPNDLKWRFALTFDYKINDKIWLITSFARDHNTGMKGSILANIGFSYNFSANRYTF